jgi:gliding motility-associated-like protein
LQAVIKLPAIDSVGNETQNALAVCIDTCRQYVLPSVFTPNGDGINDIFHPCDSTTDMQYQSTTCPPYKNVKEIDMKIFNRWGKIVFETKDKDILWDGKDIESKADCVSGVYFYTCKVYFYRIFGEDVQELHGTIQLIRNN